MKNIQNTIPAYFLSIISVLFSTNIFAQDTIHTKGNHPLLVSRLKETLDEYQFTYLTADGKTIKSRILKILVDSITNAKYVAKKEKKIKPVKQAPFDNNLMKTDSTSLVAKSSKKEKKIKKEKPVTPTAETEPTEKYWQKAISLGLNLGNVLEFNTPSGTDKKSFNFTASIDASANYSKTGSKLQSSNEMHYLLGVQKEGLGSTSPLQRSTDDFSSLHDLSIGFGKNNRWNFNLIARTATSFFTIFNGDYFQDITGLGKTKGFLSPYEVVLSPGIKYQSSKYFRLSLSPYSIRLYGLRNQEIANTGLYTQEINGHGDYILFESKRQGAELNLWYDRKVGKWLDMQYRLAFSSDYFEKFTKNGLMDGLFITKIKLFKNVYLTHRATLRDNFANKPFKPYYSQTILLSYGLQF